MEKNKVYSVAIDGPAGVGKSTITKMLAKKLGWPSLETGALYRAITCFCLVHKVDLNNEQDIVNKTKNVVVEVQYIDNVQNVFINGKNVTKFLRETKVDQNVAFVAKVPEVREKVRAVQRKIATQNNVVIEGRDIGTVVLVNSVNKFYLTATPEVRAMRRFYQLLEKNEVPKYEDILKDIKLRDEMDMSRKVSPLLPAKDAIIVDTSSVPVEKVVDIICQNIKTNKKKNNLEK